MLIKEAIHDLISIEIKEENLVHQLILLWIKKILSSQIEISLCCAHQGAPWSCMGQQKHELD